MATLVTMPKYEAYKDSGVDWIGDTPNHWNIRKLKFIDFVTMGQSPDSDATNDLEIGVPFLQGNAEFGKVSPTPKLWCTKPKKVCKKGDILFSVRAPVGAINIADQEYCIGRGLAAISVNDQFQQIRVYQMLSSVSSFKKLFTGSTFEAISTEDLKNLYLSEPSPSEVSTIANFLDKKTTQINEAIAIKEKQIDLLKERKQIIIQKAVTQGLNPNVPMKDSGLDWIGQIPEHWEVKRLKYGVGIQGGFAFQSTDFNDEGIQLLKIANLYKNRLAIERQPTYLNEKFLLSHKEWVVVKGDILMSLTGTLGKRDYGFAILIDGENKYLLNQRVARLTAKSYFKTQYLIRLLQSESYLNQIYQLPAGTKQANLSNDNVINDFVPVPSNQEQKEIASYIEACLLKNEKLITFQLEQIKKLKEYKTTLINSAVTGKIKVA